MVLSLSLYVDYFLSYVVCLSLSITKIDFYRGKEQEALVRGETRRTRFAFDADDVASISRRAVAVLVVTLQVASENVLKLLQGRRELRQHLRDFEG
ncbi:hypothetical protein RJ641_006001 [Dillenia turbinata]|uniref:Uncharacterized protein n=1 Tax=Dillenia turbinata TaxID=194707 RepID=A0AAN8V4K3_9MAGN